MFRGIDGLEGVAGTPSVRCLSKEQTGFEATNHATPPTPNEDTSNDLTAPSLALVGKSIYSYIFLRKSIKLININFSFICGLITLIINLLTPAYQAQ